MFFYNNLNLIYALSTNNNQNIFLENYYNKKKKLFH